MHILRPLFVVIALAGMILIIRTLIVPQDFGIQEKGYMYAWYRKASEEEWKARNGKYQGKEYCKDCHTEQEQQVFSSRHRAIECENCHGPALDHPTNPPTLILDRSRELCLRCHTYLPYPTSKRSEIRGIAPDGHNPGLECVSCHDAHQATKPG